MTVLLFPPSESCQDAEKKLSQTTFFLISLSQTTTTEEQENREREKNMKKMKS